MAGLKCDLAAQVNGPVKRGERNGYSQVPEDVLDDPDAFLDLVTDVPSSAPHHRIPITEAGIGEQEVNVSIRNFLDPDIILSVHGKLGAFASLDGDHRGVHMSRLVESAAECSSHSWDTVDQFIRALVLDVAGRQTSSCARVSFHGSTRIPRRTPATGRTSPDSFGIIAEASVRNGQARSRNGLVATIITACPCTQAYSWYSSVLNLANIIGLSQANAIGDHLVTFTHSQRATVTVLADAGEGGVTLQQCYEAICESTHVVHELLKRPDEHHLVRKAHERPQFTEDVIRDVAIALVERIHGHTKGSTRIRVESTALESIHAHTVQSMLENTLDELAGYVLTKRADGTGSTEKLWRNSEPGEFGHNEPYL